MEQRKNQVDIFNFLRVIALFCVLGTHSRIAIGSHIPYIHIENSFSWFMFTPAWIAMGMFFILSGYLLGKGFYNNKYSTTIKGTINFWITRALRILPMYLFLIFITFIFINPNFFFEQNYKILIPLLTFTYHGSPSCEAIGALWFVSTIFQLYLIAPIAYRFILQKFEKYKLILFFAIVILGLLYRILGQNLFHLDWYTQIYTPSWANLDYFLIGMLLNSFTQNSQESKIKKWLRPISLIGLFALIINIMILYKHAHYTFYQLYAPTVTILLFSLIIFAFDTKERIKSTPLSLKEFIKNPLRIIDYIALFSFAAYLYHSYIFTIMPDIITSSSIFPERLSNGRTLCYTYIFSSIVLFIWSSIIYYTIEKPSQTFKQYIFFKNKSNKIEIKHQK